MKRIFLGLTILAASTCYGCVAKAQCPNGQCALSAPPAYATPVRQVIHQTAQAMTQATAPKCQSERKGLFERIAERREARKAQRGGGCCR